MSDYAYYRDRLKDLPFPYACLDMQLLDQNISDILARAGDKTIRIASKSVRCSEVLRYILEQSEVMQGLMTYHGAEALHLVEQGFDDILMGYPIVDRRLIAGFAEQIRGGKKMTLMIDSIAHVDMIEEIGREHDVMMSVCVDVDMSIDFPSLHFGVWRSSVRSVEDLRPLMEHIATTSHIRVDGLMGYEAQIAGVTDNEQKAQSKNAIKRYLKRSSIKKIANRRAHAVDLIRSYGHEMPLVNGGGTGSMETTCAEACVTEVTVGSGFYNSHLFDNYRSFSLKPALFYGIPVVRIPKPGTYTCHEGGYVASGTPEPIKAPIIHLPQGGKLYPLEGAGEVQTPMTFKNLSTPLQIGDPVYMRHAKAGELCERFNEIYFLRGDRVEPHPTYRGEGKSFG